jgi:hypothetical protein
MLSPLVGPAPNLPDPDELSPDAAGRLAHIAALGEPTRSTWAESVVARIEPSLFEWSFNSADNDRGSTRFSSWTRDGAVVEALLIEFAASECLEIRARMPRDDLEGLGALVPAASDIRPW